MFEINTYQRVRFKEFARSLIFKARYIPSAIL